MNNSLETSRIVTGSLFIIASIAVAFILNFAQPFLVPLVIALLIRILIDPIIDYQIDYLHVHRIVAVFVSLCLIVFLFIIIVPFIGSSVITFLQSADDYNNKVLILIDLAISELKKFNIDIDRETIRNSLNTLPLLDWASALLSNSANFISKLVLVIIMTLFLLLGKKSENTSAEWNDIIGHVKKYIFTKFITSSITGVAAGLIYWFLGLELAFIFGSLTFILNFIPVVGSIIAVLITNTYCYLAVYRFIFCAFDNIFTSYNSSNYWECHRAKNFWRCFWITSNNYYFIINFLGNDLGNNWGSFSSTTYCNNSSNI